MAHEPIFEQRIAEALKAQGAKAEHKKMFGGVAFMVNGNMSVGITNKGDFMARFDRARHAEISKWPGAKPMTFGKGRSCFRAGYFERGMPTRSASDLYRR